MLNNINKKIILVVLVLSFSILFSCERKSVVEKIDDVNETSSSEEKAVLEENNENYIIGSTVLFGAYEQDNNSNNGKEKIEWTIIDKFDNKLLLLSKNVLDVIPYDYNIKVDDAIENNIPCKWENSYIRNWLNNDFYNAAFDENEKANIEKTKVTSGKVYGINNSYISEDMGKPTDDNVYILSKDEVRQYLGFEINQKCDKYVSNFTKFAKNKSSENIIDNNFAIWHKEKKYDEEYGNAAEYWVRSPGILTTMTDYEYGALIIEKDGHMSNGVYPYYVYKKNVVSEEEVVIEDRYYYRGVRPVICINNIFEENNFIKEEESYVEFATKSDIYGVPSTYSIEEISKAKMITEYDKRCGFDLFDVVIFGFTEQDNNISNGKEKIEWIVLDKDGDNYFLVSKYILGYCEYSNVLDKRVIWENSSLRAFANNEFYEKTFDEKEKTYIVPSKSINYDNPVYLSIEEKEYIDKVSILSFDECIKYFDVKYSECSADVETDYKKSESEKLKSLYTEYAKSEQQKEPNRHRILRPNEYWIKNQGRSGEEEFKNYNKAMYANETVFLNGYPYDMSDFLTDRGKKINYKDGFRPTIWVSVKN